ncbi:IS1 transposase [bacterium BMS3Bbin10]|nr:IS1 transposase [bacterium BMS3Bbin10]
MNRLSPEKRSQIIRCLVEGNSIRGTARLCDCVKNTVSRVLIETGEACQAYHDKHVRNLTCKRLQVDEIWAFIGCKQKNVPKHRRGEAGDCWTWTAIDADTKLVPSWMVGPRDGQAAIAFMDDLASRLASRVQLTSDGHKPYLEAVEGAFGGDIDYAMLIKMYGAAPESMKGRYSPAECIGARKTRIEGDPDPKHVNTSYAERNNLTMRMQMRRFTRLTNAFSKKIENHAHAVSLHFRHYNFCRIHQSLRVTPAMAAGVTDKLWSVDDLVAMSDAYWAEKNAPKKRGPYKKRIASEARA